MASRVDIEARVAELEDAIRTHRTAQGQDLCWENDLELWAALGDGVVPDRKVPPWPEFMAGCVRYRQMLEKPPFSTRTPGRIWPSQVARTIIKVQQLPDGARPCDSHTFPLFLSALFDLVDSSGIEQVSEVRIPSQLQEHAPAGVFGPGGLSRLWGAGVVWEEREDFQVRGTGYSCLVMRWGELDLGTIEEAESRRNDLGSENAP